MFDPKTKTVYTPNTNALTPLESGNNDLTNGEKNDIIEERKKTNWVKGSKGRFAGSVPVSGGGRIPIREYIRLCHEIVTDHPEYEDGSRHFCYNRDYFYTFTVIEPGLYNFEQMIKIEGNREEINKRKAEYDEQD